MLLIGEEEVEQSRLLRDLRNGILLGGGSQVVLGTVDGLQSLSPRGHSAVPKGNGRTEIGDHTGLKCTQSQHLLSFRAC